MGGQACVFYGAAEFSRDTDVALLAESGNLERLSYALNALEAERIAFPPFEIDYLQRGHAVHFRCQRADVAGMRVDVLSVMRGVAPFAELWQRRTTLEVEGSTIELISLPDLVMAKKTQRDKDWPMIRRLVEAHHARNRDDVNDARVEFWLRECRTPALLIELARQFPDALTKLEGERLLLADARAGNDVALAQALDAEESRERAADRLYWAPLRAELEKLRLERPRTGRATDDS